jgi:hypothetical protein
MGVLVPGQAKNLKQKFLGFVFYCLLIPFTTTVEWNL